MRRFPMVVTLGIVGVFLVAALTARPARAITFGQPDTENRFSNVGAIVVTEGLPGAPYVVASGVLIHPRVFLTAGHITAEGESLLEQGVPLFDISRISFGTDALDPSTWVEAVATMTHPDYRSPGFSDYGVIILKEPVNLPCATLPYEGLLDDLRDSGLLVNQGTPQRFISVGYGRTLEFPPPEEVAIDGLRRYSFPEYVGLDKDELLMNQNFAAGNSGAASGDSGGPVFWPAPNGELIVVAIHRAADAQRVAILFGSRTDIPQALDFVDFIIAIVEAGVYD
jgi:hypothetical protein